MLRYFLLCFSLVFTVSTSFGQEADANDASAQAQQLAQAEGVAASQDAAEAPAPAEEADPDAPKTLAGMSILGNEEAPKSLVIVPWKSSEIGDGLGVTDAIDERARPVDKDVFLREVHYYELRSGAGG